MSNEEIDELQRLNAELTLANLELKQKIEQLEKECNNWQDQSDSYEDELDKFELKELKKERDSLITQVESLENDRDGWKLQSDSYEEELEELEKEYLKYENSQIDLQEALDEYKLKWSPQTLTQAFKERDLAIVLVGLVLDIHRGSKRYKKIKDLFHSGHFQLCPEAGKYTEGVNMIWYLDHRTERQSIEETLLGMIHAR